MTWTPGDVSLSETLTDSDHLYPDHINELRQAFNSTWTAESGYIRASSRVDSGNTKLVINDTLVSGTPGILIGNPGTDATGYPNQFGADLLEIGLGTAASPTTSKKAALYIEKWTNDDSIADGNLGAASFKCIKKSGESNVRGAISSCIRQGGYGDVIGFQANAYSNVALGPSAPGGGSVYGLWVIAGQGHAPVAPYGQVEGIEVNINMLADYGHWEAHSGDASVGFWFYSYPYASTIGFALAPTAISANTKVHTGFAVLQNSIVPSFGNLNEGFLVQGASAASGEYGGMRMNGYLKYAIDLKSAVISTYAISLPANVPIVGGAGDANLLYYSSGGDLVIGTSATVMINADGNPKALTTGGNDSGGAGYKVLRVPN